MRSDWTSHCLLSGDVHFQVSAPTYEIGAFVQNFLNAFRLGNLQSESSPPEVVEIRIGIERESDAGKIESLFVQVGGEIVATHVSQNGLIEEICFILRRLVLDGSNSSLHLHAAACIVRDKSVLLVGPSGTGKSTIVVALADRGGHYLTDEMVGVSLRPVQLDSGEPEPTIRPFAMPPRLSWDSVSLLRRYGVAVPSEACPVGRNCYLPASEGAGSTDDSLGIDHIVLLSGASGGRPRMERFDQPAQVARLLLASSFDSGRAGAQALYWATMIAGRATSWRLYLGENPVSAAEEIEAAVVESRFESSNTEQWPRFGSLGSTAWSEIASRVTLWSPRSLRSVVLDEWGSRVWRETVELAGREQASSQISWAHWHQSDPEVQQLMADLVRCDVLEPAPPTSATDCR